MNIVSEHSCAVHGYLGVCLGGAEGPSVCALVPYPGAMHGSLGVCSVDSPLFGFCTD